MPTVPTAVSDRVESVRLAIAAALRDRVIGDNAEEKRDAIMNATGSRWFQKPLPSSSCIRTLRCSLAACALFCFNLFTR